MAIAGTGIVALAMGGALTLIASLLLWWTQRWHGHLTYDSPSGIQKFHLHPTPRVGGLALLPGLITVWLLDPSPMTALLGPMILASTPAFLGGFIEDMTGYVGVRERLLFTMASGLLASLLTGISLTRVEVWGLDSLLGWQPAAILFTAFAVAGVANAINIIDGFHGLACGVLLIALCAMAGIAWQVHDNAILGLCLTLGILTWSFMLVNFPYGKLFLGDGGAYLMGFLLAWTAVLLAMRNPGVSVWAPLLCCAYPVLETVFSMARRYNSGRKPGQPDRLHLHSLIYLGITRHRLKRFSPVLHNAAVAPVTWGLALVPAGLAVLFYNETTSLIGGFLFSALVYAYCYVRLMPVLNSQQSSVDT